MRHRLADRQSRADQATTRLTDLARHLDALQTELATATETRREHQAAVETARRGHEEAAAALVVAQTEADLAEADLAAAQTQAEGLRKGLTELQASQQRASARLEALDRLAREGAGLYAGVREVLQAVDHGELTGLPGTVSSLIRTPADLERAVEAVLGAQLQDVVANTWDDAQAAIRRLKRRNAGRATFLPLDTLRPPPPLELPSWSGVIGVGSDLVHHDPAYRPVVQLLLARTAIVQSLDAARRLHRELRGSFRIVTLDGEIVRSGGSVTGGDGKRGRGTGLLSRERDRRELREEVAELERATDATAAELTEVERAVDALRDALKDRRQALAGATAAARTRERQLDEATRRLEDALQRHAWHASRLAEAQTERDRTDERRSALAAEAVEAQETLAGLTTREQELTARLADLVDDDIARRVAACRTTAAVLTQERESQGILLDSRLREATRLRRQIDAQDQRLHSLSAELHALETGLEDLATAYEEARSRASGLAARVTPLETQLAEREAALDKLEQGEDAARRALREAEHRLSQAEVDAGRREDQVQSLRREIEETLEIVIGNLPDSISTQQPLPLDDIVSQLPKVTELPHGLEDQIRDLRTQIRQARTDQHGRSGGVR